MEYINISDLYFRDMTKVSYNGYDRYAGDGTFLKIVSIIGKNN